MKKIFAVMFAAFVIAFGCGAFADDGADMEPMAVRTVSGKLIVDDDAFLMSADNDAMYVYIQYDGNDAEASKAYLYIDDDGDLAYIAQIPYGVSGTCSMYLDIRSQISGSNLLKGKYYYDGTFKLNRIQSAENIDIAVETGNYIQGKITIPGEVERKSYVSYYVNVEGWGTSRTVGFTTDQNEAYYELVIPKTITELKPYIKLSSAQSGVFLDNTKIYYDKENGYVLSAEEAKPLTLTDSIAVGVDFTAQTPKALIHLAVQNPETYPYMILKYHATTENGDYWDDTGVGAGTREPSVDIYVPISDNSDTFTLWYESDRYGAENLPDSSVYINPGGTFALSEPKEFKADHSLYNLELPLATRGDFGELTAKGAVKDQNGNEINAENIVSAESFYIDTYSTLQGDKEAKLVVALYKDGKLIDADVSDITVGKLTTRIAAAKNPDITDADSVRIFVWDSLNRMLPILRY